MGSGWDRRSSRNAAVAAVIAALVAAAAVGDWLAGAALLLLFTGFTGLRSAEGPPVLVFAFGFQWVQVTSGLFYGGLLGRRLTAHDQSDYRTMVGLGLASLAVLLAGLVTGRRLGGRRQTGARPETAFRTDAIILLYIISVAVAQALLAVAWHYPQFTQAMIAIARTRYLFLFLLLRRLVSERVHFGAFAFIMAAEVAFGFTSYFADFRESIFTAILVVSERFDRRRRSHLALAAVLGVVLAGTALLWTGVKSEYRQEFRAGKVSSSAARLRRVAELAVEWVEGPLSQKVKTADRLVDRLWAVYYPALAVERVPRDIPHTGGAILTDAIRHVTMPRFFFPDKKKLTSDSAMVRKYSGVWVAGEERGVSIAFGYVAESYVDFGIPGMFVPILVWGVVLGFLYEFFLRVITVRELAIAFVTPAFWLSLYLFERSWARTLGLSLMTFVIVGGGTILLDRMLKSDAARRRQGLTPDQAPHPQRQTTAGIGR